MKTKHFEMNTTGKDYFVGDLHGMYDLLMDHMASVNFDFGADRLFCVGDLIDRGPDSVKCLELLNKPWFHCVLGNHEELMLGSHGARTWIQNGGEWSYDLSREELNSLRDLIEEKCYQLLSVDTKLGKVGVLHAESEEDWDNNDLYSKEINTWARSKIRSGNKSPIENIDLVVVGHTPLKKMAKLGNVLYIDTGACFVSDNGFLTILDSDQIFQALEDWV
jgi:serine/threonine protein phosphatase 1